MIQKIKQLVFVTLASSMLFATALVPALSSTVSAADNITSSVCQGVNNAANGTNKTDCGTAGSNQTDLSTIAKKIVSIFSIIVGIVAVIMIIYGGFRYITSGGDSSKVGSAKSALIYALIGLVIVALAQIIVHYVLNTSQSLAGSSGIGQ